MTGWSPWRPVEDPMPYIDWWHHLHEDAPSELSPERWDDLLGLRPVGARGRPQLPDAAVPPARTVRRPYLSRTARLVARAAPLPAQALNPGFAAHFAAHGDWLPPPALLPDLPEDTVIVGVIDQDIALGQRRFRTGAGGTRVLASWQMNAPSAGQPWLPYGAELYRADIDRLLAETSGGSLAGRLDEAAFNRAAGLVDDRARFGPRALMGRHAHGTHVLDAAAGAVPGDAADPLGRAAILAVNLPQRAALGASGEFLNLYMLHALQRIVDLSDAIWLKNHPGTGGPIGYPLVVNISFGRQAGAKTLLDPLPRMLRRLRQSRRGTHLPVDVVMPSGNDNLAQAYAELTLGPGQSAALAWRVQPGDQTANYAEIWVRGRIGADAAGRLPVEIDLCPPGAAPALRPARVEAETSLGEIARLYCLEVVRKRPGRDGQFQILACLAPSARSDGSPRIAPAGGWQIHLGNAGTAELEICLAVQTDQSVLPAGTDARRSYFESPGYVRYDSAGRLLDTAAAETATVGGVTRPEIGDPVRRHGTINSSSSGPDAACIGGYRVSDGLEVPYSSSGVGRPGDPGDAPAGRLAPTAALPSEDGYAHPGRLGAGAGDGSVVAMSGTSFATAEATRLVARAKLAALAAGAPLPDGRAVLAGAGQAAEAAAHHPTPTIAVKTGRGRALPGYQRTLPRTGGG